MIQLIYPSSLPTFSYLLKLDRSRMYIVLKNGTHDSHISLESPDLLNVNIFKNICKIHCYINTFPAFQLFI